jgi:hypothetical protein
MLVISLITLVVASASAFLSLNIQEEVFKVATSCFAILSFFIALFLAPWTLKLAIFAVPLLIEKLNKWSTESSLN